MSLRNGLSLAIFGLVGLALMGCGIATPTNLTPQTFQTAVLSVSDGPVYDYGPVQVENRMDHTFTVSNFGQETATNMNSSFHLSIHFKYRDGTYPGTGGTCADQLDPGDTCTVEVTFEPQFNGNFQDLVTIDYHNSVQMTSTTSPLIRGTGFGGPPSNE